MKIDEAVSILRAHNEWRRSPAHLPEDARGAMGDPRQIGIAIDTVCDALSQSDDWARALRLADDAAESVICTEGHNTEGRQWVLYPEQIAADPYLEDCIAHLEWRGIAKAVREEGRVTVIFEAMEQTLKARIPECAEFAGIAQDLDFVVAALRERLGEGGPQ
jgi:hypothetical protein